MRCLLIFNHLNDIIYANYDKKFAQHLTRIAENQGLLNKKDESNQRIGSNVLVQIFSPLITSQRIMSCQFGNSYTTVECDDDINILFEEYMGYLFVMIGKSSVTFLRRLLNTYIAIVKYVCGPDVLQIKSKSYLVSKLIDVWVSLQNNDQSILVEAVEQLSVNSDLSSATIQALKESVEKIMSCTEHTKVHAVLTVQNKLLGLYSSPHAKELSPSDIIFLIILSETHSTQYDTELPEDDGHSSLDDTGTFSHRILLEGSNQSTKSIPYLIHVCPITEGINLIYALEVGNSSAATAIHETFIHLHALQVVQLQRDVESLRPAFENLDLAVKKLSDCLRKVKGLEGSWKQLVKKWDFMKKKYQEFLKNSSDEALLRAESCTGGFLDNLKELFASAIDYNHIDIDAETINESAGLVGEKLLSYNDFLKVKAIKNFSLGSRGSLTINKYLEEFPGLVHFLYVDRSTHRITAPTLDFDACSVDVAARTKIWNMIEFARNYLEKGHLSVIWKDSTFSYAYFLWFEDSSGATIKPTITPMNVSKNTPQPGIICGDFYTKLKEVCFPKMAPHKIRCYELYCVHLGLATASCVLEHTRRLAATVWELTAHQNHPMDLL